MAEEVEVRLERVSSSKVAPIHDDIPTTTTITAAASAATDKHQDVYIEVIGFGERDKPLIQEAVDSQDGWLPITESRKGSTWTASFHLLCSGIGIQSLAIPFAFVSLGWFWGIFCLALIYVWQLYTIWILVQLHESSSGTRYSRYLQLSITAFGEKLGKLLSIFPVMYLSGGTCVMFIINAGTTMDLFSQFMSRDASNSKTLSGAEWFLAFVCVAIVVAQFFPNLNSLSRVSFIGSVAAFTLCTMIWILSITEERPEGVFHEPSKASSSDAARFRDILNAIGIIALAFRGHNVVLEIQGTMPSNTNHRSKKHMWRGVMISYCIIAICLFPLAIVGYWAYGNMMPATGGMLIAFAKFHQHNTSKFIMGTICLIAVIHYLSAFQIYAMPVFDNLERIYTTKNNKPCPRWVRSGIKFFFAGLTFFIAVAFPFLGKLGALIGAIALPLTLAYPCLMWISIKKPRRHSTMWSINIVLGSSGAIISVFLLSAAIWSLVDDGLKANFFEP